MIADYANRLGFCRPNVPGGVPNAFVVAGVVSSKILSRSGSAGFPHLISALSADDRNVSDFHFSVLLLFVGYRLTQHVRFVKDYFEKLLQGENAWLAA
jgi:hypothetical protein